MKILSSLVVPCALSDSYVCTTLIPPLTIKAPWKQGLCFNHICIPYSNKHSVCITGANKYLLNLILEKLLPMLGGWRNQPAGYCIIYKNRQEMDLKGAVPTEMWKQKSKSWKSNCPVSGSLIYKWMFWAWIPVKRNRGIYLKHKCWEEDLFFPTEKLSSVAEAAASKVAVGQTNKKSAIATSS